MLVEGELPIVACPCHAKPFINPLFDFMLVCFIIVFFVCTIVQRNHVYAC